MKNLSLEGNSTFTEFKKLFHERFKDISIFETPNFNLVKVVLDGLKVNYKKQFDPYSFIDKSNILIKICFAYRHWQFSSKKRLKKFEDELKQFRDRKLLIKGPKRVSIKSEVRKSAFFLFSESIPEKERLFFDFFENTQDRETDIDAHGLTNVILYTNSKVHDWGLIEELKEKIFQLKRSGQFSKMDIQNVILAIQKFYLQYVLWNFVLLRLNCKSMVFQCHYHNEGMLWALKKNSVKAIELQHGIISESDIFYVMPKSVLPFRKKALFADEIWVYGETWKNILMNGFEYDKDQIVVFGYYPGLEIDQIAYNKLKVFSANRKVIAIATQPKLKEYFIQYIKFLISDFERKKLFSEYCIVIKPHPGDPLGLYNSFDVPGKVIVTDVAVNAFLSASDIIVSSYSTVLVEAKLFNLKCYSLMIDERMDYIQQFLKSGISSPLSLIQNPVDLKNENIIVNSVDFFTEVNRSMLPILYN